MFTVLSCLVNLKYFSFRDFTIGANTFLAIVFLAGAIIYPFFLTFKLTSQFEDLRKLSVRSKIGEAYAELNISKGPSVLSYNFYFFARRIVLPIILMFCPILIV